MIPLFIPYLNRSDLLRKAVESIPQLPNLHVTVINNSNAAVDAEAHYWRPDVPLSFAQSQNLMLSIASQSEQPFYLFMHSDAEAIGDTVQRLAAMANAFTIQKRKWGAIWTAYDALCAFNTQAMRSIGGWDAELSWYHSDADCYRRLKLAGFELIESNLPVKHEPSQTLKSDSAIERNVDLMYPCRVAYYKKKWGGDVGKELYSVPWNGL